MRPGLCQLRLAVEFPLRGGQLSIKAVALNNHSLDRAPSFASLLQAICLSFDELPCAEEKRRRREGKEEEEGERREPKGTERERKGRGICRDKHVESYPQQKWQLPLQNPK